MNQRTILDKLISTLSRFVTDLEHQLSTKK